MIGLQNYINKINEARQRRDDNVADLDDIDVDKIPGAVQNGRKVPLNVAQKVQKGKSADGNGTKGLWAIDAPSEEDKAGDSWKLLDPNVMTNNQRRLLSRMKNKKDFIVYGEAGWGKTDLIVETAHKCGLTVLTVYLDKAESTDLGGIPIPMTKRTDDGDDLNYTANFMPAWAVYMAMNPDTQFLLFFDEMNQAQPDVMNALMPIVLKHEICGVVFDNYFVGAAGNFNYENSSVNELSGPLKDRLSQITWESRTPDTWKAAFSWAHKKYDDKCGAELIDKCEELKDYWASPRNLTRNIYRWVANELKNPPMFDTPEDVYDDLMSNCIYKDVDTDSRNVKNAIAAFADWIVNYVNNGGKSNDGRSSRRSKSDEGIEKEYKEEIIEALRKGYVISKKSDGGDGKKHVVTPDNVLGDDTGGIFDMTVFKATPEIIKRIIRQMEDEGNPPRFKDQKEGAEYAESHGWVVDDPIK